MTYDLPVLLAETNVWGILFFIVLVVLEYLLPYLRRKKQQESGEPPDELSPEQEDELVRRLREAAEAAQQAAREAMAEEEPPEPVVQVDSAERQRRHLERVEAAAERLRASVRAWRSAASGVIDKRSAERLVGVVRDRFGDFEGSVSQWNESDVAAAQTAAGVMVDVATAVEPLRAPGRLIMWRAVESLTERVLETAPVREELPEGLVLLPLAQQLTSPRTMDALDTAGLVPVLFPSGGASPRRALALMVAAIREVLEQDHRDLLPIVGEAMDRLARELTSGSKLAAALIDFLRRPDARSILLREIPGALAMHHSGPLAALMYGADALEQIGPQPAMMRREAFASKLVSTDLVHDDEALAVWDVIAGSLVDALSDTGYGGPMASGLWVLIEPWGPAEDSQAERTVQWLGKGARAAAPSRVVDPIVALVAWSIAGRLDGQVLRRLADAVEGKHQAVAEAPDANVAGQTSVRPSVTGRAGARDWRQVLAMQVVLGPPRARLGPQRVASMWGRRRPGRP